jgi:hypothetical protein
MNFIEALTQQLHAWQDETTWISPTDLQEMLIQAAKATLPEELSPVTVRREVDPEDMKARTILEIEGEYLTSLCAEDIATLRALLIAYDETIPARVGDPLSMPTRLRDGRVVSEVTEELLKEEE